MYTIAMVFTIKLLKLTEGNKTIKSFLKRIDHAFEHTGPLLDWDCRGPCRLVRQRANALREVREAREVDPRTVRACKLYDYDW
jgi:hypothetical protein